MTHTYAAAHGRRYRYYVCRQRGQAACPARSVSARLIEESVLTQLQVRLGGDQAAVGKQGEIETWVRRLVERVSYDGMTGGVRLQLATIDS